MVGDPEELGQALVEIRKRRGMQQCEMAQRAGITKSMASCYERGRRHPSLATLDALLVALDVDLRVLHRALRFVRHRKARRRCHGGEGRGGREGSGGSEGCDGRDGRGIREGRGVREGLDGRGRGPGAVAVSAAAVSNRERSRPRPSTRDPGGRLEPSP